MDATTVESIIAMPLGAAASNSNTNMSCGSSSSSSNSSGYASATTPTNPASAGSSSNHSQYSDSHSNTPVGLVEPTPVATIAAVTPYYNETFHQQQQQQHQTQLHHPPHPPQYQHQTHSYQLAEQQLPTPTQYDNTYDSYAYPSGGESYPQSVGGGERNLLGMRHATSYYTTLEKPSKQPTQTAIQPHSNTANDSNNKIFSNNNTESLLHTSKRIGESGTPAKPQAAATPFFAQSAQTGSSGTYGDSNKYRISTAPKLPTLCDYISYGNQQLDINNTMNYTQNFSQHHAAKPLQDIPYGAGSTPMKPFNAMPNARLPQQRLGMHYGNTAMPMGIPIGSASNNSNSNNNNSSIYIDKYDKYLYTAVTTVAQSPYYTSTPPANLSAMPYNAVPYAAAPPASATVPPQYAAEMPNDPYRKSSASSSWHWSMDYANGNCRSLPPPNGIPTAAIPPTNASYVPSNATAAAAAAAAAANRDIYYTSEKYSNKYDKYNSYYNPHQQYMTSNATGRSAWSNSPHASAHLVPALAERLSHPYPTHHAPLPTSGVPNALAASAHPSLAYHHPYTPAAATAAARQNCCSQPFQQQNYCYPRTTHHPHLPPNAYSPHAQTPPYGTIGTTVGSNNNSVVKYNLLDYGPVSKTKLNTNDVYAATSTYEATNMNYHSHPASMAPGPHYANTVGPTAVIGHPPLNRNITPSSHSDIATVYYNDLNMQTSYDNYLGPTSQPTPLVEERRESLVQRVDHLPNLPPTYTQPTATKSSLIDYRKPAVTPNDDCFIAEPTLTNLDEHMAINMSHGQYNNTYGLASELRPNDGGLYNKNATRENTIKSGHSTPTTPTTKTYSSLRDFLSTWNEDEEDYGCTNDLQFVEAAPQAMEQVINTEDNTNSVEVINKTTSLPSIPSAANKPASYGAAEPVATYRTQPLPLVVNNLQLKESFNLRPKSLTNIGPDGYVNMEENQYTNINLPDIIIDIEKSGGATPNIISIPKSNTNNAAEKCNVRDVNYDCFDVEKELDELETKKVKTPKLNTDTIPIRNDSVIMKAATEALGVVSPDATVESVILETIENLKFVDDVVEKIEKDFLFAEHKVEHALSAVQVKTESAFDRSIECDTTTSSNGSTFEKEYETFINKIGNEFEYKTINTTESKFTAGVKDKSAHSEINTDIAKLNQEMTPNAINNTMGKQNAENDMEIAQKIKSFSKFYKRKRKSTETSEGKDAIKLLKQSHDLEQELIKETNIPETNAKRRIKRKPNDRIDRIRLKCKHKRKNKAAIFYQRRLRALRRYYVKINKRLDITALLKEELIKVAKQDIPLTNRQSVKQISKEVETDFEEYFNPKTLKCLSVAFINSEPFQNKLLVGVEFRKEIVLSKDININEESAKDSTMIQEVNNCEIPLQSTVNIDHEICNELTLPDTLKSLVAENKFEVTMSKTLDEIVRKEHSNQTSEVDEKQILAGELAEHHETTEMDFECIEDIQHETDPENHQEMDVKDSKNELDFMEIDNFEEVHSPAYIAEPAIDCVEASTKQLGTEEKHERNDDNIEIKVIEPEAYDADISADDEKEMIKSLSNDVHEPFSELNTSENMADTSENQFNANESVEYKATDTENLSLLTTNIVNQVNPDEDHVNAVNEDVQSAKQQTVASDLIEKKVEDIELEAMDLTWATETEEDSAQNQKIELKECVESGTHDGHLTEQLTKFTETCNTTAIEGASRDAEYSTRHDDSHSSVIAMEVAASPFKDLHLSSPVDMKSDNSEGTDITMLKAFDLDEQAKLKQCFSGDIDLSDMENSVDMFGARRSAEYFTATSKNYFYKSGEVNENSADSSSTSSSDSSTSSASRRSITSSSSSSSSSSDENSQSTITTVHSDFNEMKELERELSQHQANEARVSLELENGEKAATAIYTDDNSSNGMYTNSSKTITEHDIKTLKEILESDSDGHEEIRPKLEVVKDASFDDEEISASTNTKVLEEQQADTTNDMTEDNKLMQNEDSNVSNGKYSVATAVAERDCVGTEVVEEECVESCDKTCDVEGLTRELSLEESQSQNETLFCAAINVDDDGSGVPSLKKISLDYLERATSNENHTLIKRTEDALNSKIPKLSDLCKNALSSSFEISVDNNSNSNSNNTNQNSPETLQERELSVEEALAEMYRQAGVTSDPEDGDAEEREAQDVVLINLEEILVNDSDLYVLQCDMNENVLSVVAHAQAPDSPAQLDESIENIERAVNAVMPTVELMGLDSPQEEVTVTDDMQTDFRGPFMNVHDDVDNSPSTVPLTPYITPPHTVEYVEDELRITNDDSLNTQFDFPAIHHEEIVSHDYKRLKRQVLYNSLREKYVLKRVHFRPHHGNRVLKKYIHRWILQCLIARFRERELKKAHMYVEE